MKESPLRDLVFATDEIQKEMARYVAYNPEFKDTMQTINEQIRIIRVAAIEISGEATEKEKPTPTEWR